MKILVALLTFLAVSASTSTTQDTCMDASNNACSDPKTFHFSNDFGTKCTSVFGAMTQISETQGHHFSKDMQKLIQGHFELSLKYLALASHFNQWNWNRKGFQSYFNKLSDEAWEDAVTIMQHFIKRGGKLKGEFAFVPSTENFELTKLTAVVELTALGAALEWQKKSVEDTLQILRQRRVNTTNTEDHIVIHSDPEFTHFLAEQISDRHVLKLKHMASYVNTLNDILQSSRNVGLALHIFDTQVLK